MVSYSPRGGQSRTPRNPEMQEKRQGAENEIRVTARPRNGGHIAYALALLRGEEGKKKYNSVKISAMGAAIRSAVNVAEVLKRRVAGLHQITEISSEVVHDTYEKANEQKEKREGERKLSTILITLSLDPLDVNHVGYQAPVPESEVRSGGGGRPYFYRGRGRGRFRGGRRGRAGGRGGGASPEDDEAQADEESHDDGSAEEESECDSNGADE